ncbi:MAG: DUF3817 domain-containing protein [Bacteroidia bacterium]|nr:DUF3817 domain-containing protein [Bacteroidia bacterium]
MIKDNLSVLRILAILEGVSYLLLFGLSMPLKYIWKITEPNMVIGMAHGVLFLAYCLWVLIVGLQKKWSTRNILLAGFASLVPFGTFVADAKIFKPARAEA